MLFISQLAFGKRDGGCPSSSGGERMCLSKGIDL